MIQLFCDMDGVLADFDTGYERLTGARPDKEKDNVDWDKVREHPNFFLSLPPMADAHELWDVIKPYRPIVLTGVSKYLSRSFREKQDWVHAHLGFDVPVVGCLSRLKSSYCQPGDIIIDDREEYKPRWEAKGGIWITHTSAKSSLWDLNVILHK